MCIRDSIIVGGGCGHGLVSDRVEVIIGAVVGFAALMRLRPKGLAEPGPNMLLSHCLFGMGLTAFLVPLAMIITTTQNERLEAGTGLWLSLVSGALMIAVSIYENYRRGAKAA